MPLEERNVGDVAVDVDAPPPLALGDDEVALGGARVVGYVIRRLGPDELSRGAVLFARRPVKSIPELNVGLDWAKIDATFAAGSKLTAAGWQALERRYFRLRVDGFVERPAGARGPQWAGSLRRPLLE